jgi:hypothetical protein
MPLPKQLSAWNNVLKETLAKGRAKFGAKKYSLKRGMKEASKIYKRMSKTAKKRGGSALTPLKIGGGEEEVEEKPMAGGEGEGEEEKPMEGGNAELEKKPFAGGKKNRSKKAKA